MNLNVFCKYQEICKDGVLCLAHLHEGRCFNCPYKSLNEAKAMSHDWDGNITKYPCSDAEPFDSKLLGVKEKKE